MIREAAAKAICPFIFYDEISDFLIHLLDSIPDSFISMKEKNLNFNQLHGTLMQIREILLRNDRNMTTEQRRDITLNILTKFYSKTWLLSSSCVLPVNSLYLRCIADFIISIDKKNQFFWLAEDFSEY